MRRLRVTLVVVVAIALAMALQFAPGLAAQQRGAGPPPNSAQPVKGTGLISGKVVDAATDQPIDAALVTVVGRTQLPTGPPAPGRAAGAQNQTRLVTGADGRFVLHDLPAGNFTVSASSPGYISASYGQAQPTSQGQPIVLADGERVTDAKIRLWQSAVLTGTVLDEAGDPAVGINVHVFRRSVYAGRITYNDTGNASSDDRGLYRISSLTPGEYIVVVPQMQTTLPMSMLDSMMQGLTSSSPIGGAMVAELMGSSGPAMRGSTGVRVDDFMLSSDNGVALVAPDGRMLAYQTVFFPSATTPSQATPITLRSGEVRSGADLQLRMVPTMRVSGVVTGAVGPAGVTSVRLMPASSSEPASSGFDADVAMTTTSADGAFTFLGIPPGQYVARVYKPPMPQIPPEMASNPMVQAALGGRGGGPAALYGDASVAVGSSNVNDVTILLTPGVKLSGRVEFVGASPQPMPQQLRTLSINVQPADGRRIGGMLGIMPNQNAVNDRGEFTVSGYPPGTYLMSVSAPTGWLVKSLTVDGRNVVGKPLEIKDSDIDGIVVTYTDKIGQLSGNVHGVNGAAIAPGTTIFVLPPNYRDWYGTVAVRSATAVKGAYTIGGLLADDYLVAALDGLDVPEIRDSGFLDALARVATHVTLAEGEKKTIDLTTVKVSR